MSRFRRSAGARSSWSPVTIRRKLSAGVGGRPHSYDSGAPRSAGWSARGGGWGTGCRRSRRQSAAPPTRRCWPRPGRCPVVDGDRADDPGPGGRAGPGDAVGAATVPGLVQWVTTNRAHPAAWQTPWMAWRTAPMSYRLAPLAPAAARYSGSRTTRAAGCACSSTWMAVSSERRRGRPAEGHGSRAGAARPGGRGRFPWRWRWPRCVTPALEAELMAAVCGRGAGR
jgi:hypothetical protein